MKYFSVCSGIEAASVAWKPLGWTAHAFAEIEAFPSAVLAFHYPTVPNWGDLTRFKDWPDAAFDIFVGGTPCQSFSVAGLRAGLDDPRGNLALTYLAVLDRYRPRWMVWENVPGVLSADEGGALGAFLGGLGQLGYGWAYRSLDAQYFRLAQRRRRVFVVGHSGDWRRAAAVLFERESLSGHPAPRRETGEVVALPVTCRVDRGGEHREMHGNNLIAHSLRADGFDASEDGTGRGTPIPTLAQTLTTGGTGERGYNDPTNATLVPVALFDERQITSPDNRMACRVDAAVPTMHEKPFTVAFSAKDYGADAGDIAPTLRAGGHDRSHANGGVMPAVAFANTAGDTALGMSKPGVPPITGRNGDPGNVLLGMQVRRLTPRECERLQGFPDDYTLIPYRGKPAKDGPRYKALGNSMAVPVMAWIGGRIALVEALDLERTA